MHKHHSFQLPKVSPDSPRHRPFEHFSEKIAEDSLFEISKYDEVHAADSFWKEISKLSLAKKHIEKSSLSVPKKKPVELLPVVDISTFRQSNQDLNLSILNTSTFSSI